MLRISGGIKNMILGPTAVLPRPLRVTVRDELLVRLEEDAVAHREQQLISETAGRLMRHHSHTSSALS